MNLKNLISVLICSISSLSSCQNEVMEINSLKNYTIIYTNNNTVRTENYVISNPVSDKQEMKKKIDDFITKNIDFKTFQSYEVIEKVFYTKTSILTKDYKENTKGYLTKDRLSDHNEDILYVVLWNFNKDKTVLYENYCFWEDGLMKPWVLEKKHDTKLW